MFRPTRLGTIVIPKIGVNRPFFEGIQLAVLNQGPGHFPKTALPGQVGKVVVAGHRVSHNRDFRNLNLLAPGDLVQFVMPNGTFDYSVTRLEVVNPRRDYARVIKQGQVKEGALFACHPPGKTISRIVAWLSFVEPAPATPTA